MSHCIWDGKVYCLSFFPQVSFLLWLSLSQCLEGWGQNILTNCVPCIGVRAVNTSWASSMAFAVRFFTAFVHRFIVLLLLLIVGVERGLLLLSLQFLSTINLLNFASLLLHGVKFTWTIFFLGLFCGFALHGVLA